MISLGDTIEFRCTARLMRGVLVYIAPDAGEDAAAVRVRYVEQWYDSTRNAADEGWSSRDEHDRFWSLPKQVAAIPARRLVRVTGIKLGDEWQTWTADVWESIRAEDEHGRDMRTPVAVGP